MNRWSVITQAPGESLIVMMQFALSRSLLALVEMRLMIQNAIGTNAH